MSDLCRDPVLYLLSLLVWPWADDRGAIRGSLLRRTRARQFTISLPSHKGVDSRSRGTDVANRLPAAPAYGLTRTFALASERDGDSPFLTVADAQGLSYYADATLARRLSMAPARLEMARSDLIRVGLIAWQRPLYQVLALDTPAPEPAPPRGLTRM